MRRSDPHRFRRGRRRCHPESSGISLRRQHAALIAALVVLVAQSTMGFSIEQQHPATRSRGRRQLIRFQSYLWMTISENVDENDRNKKNGKRKKKKVLRIESNEDKKGTTGPSRIETELVGRVGKLEELVARQEMEIQKLRQECRTLAEAASAFGKVVELLREAGLQTPDEEVVPNEPKESPIEEQVKKTMAIGNTTVEYFDDSEIFGTAPASVIDAADSAGAAILAGMLGGKQRMLVDVRDAELSRDPETLVQFIELAILPVAAGLEGLKSKRNRVKIVFPTVSHLLQYRRTMALAAPDVVTLSTLGFDPVEKQDNIVVIVAPSPDDEEGLMAMNELLEPTESDTKPITQPLVILNPHMVPVSGPASKFEVAYHLRLLSVQFMTGDNAPEYFHKWEEEIQQKVKRRSDDDCSNNSEAVIDGPSSSSDESCEVPQEEDAALEAAMKHAAELGMNQGVTRAMVIRAFPRPWHVFVDTSPGSDADFEVAATFDDEPSQDDVNFAIVECLEGSEHEDEIVAQEMQQALEAGQLDRVSEMLGNISPSEKQNVEQDGEEEDTASDDSGHGDDD